MKPGSLVVISKMPPEYRVCKWLPVQDEKTVYEVRKTEPCICGCGRMDVFLQEGTLGDWPPVKEIPPSAWGLEVGIPVWYVREVQPPEEVNATEIVEEAISVDNHAYA